MSSMSSLFATSSLNAPSPSDRYDRPPPQSLFRMTTAPSASSTAASTDKTSTMATMAAATSSANQLPTATAQAAAAAAIAASRASTTAATTTTLSKLCSMSYARRRLLSASFEPCAVAALLPPSIALLHRSLSALSGGRVGMWVVLAASVNALVAMATATTTTTTTSGEDSCRRSSRRRTTRDGDPDGVDGVDTDAHADGTDQDHDQDRGERDDKVNEQTRENGEQKKQKQEQENGRKEEIKWGEGYRFASKLCGRIRPPILAVTTSAVFCRCVAPLVEEWYCGLAGGDVMNVGFRWWPNGGEIAVMMAAAVLRASLGMAALSVAVTLRYVGRFSVVQCSPVPVRTNLYQDAWVALRTSTFVTLLDTLAGPDPNPNRKSRSDMTKSTAGEALYSSLYSSSLGEGMRQIRGRNGRRPRYAHPTLLRCAAQLVIHSAAGAAFYALAALPLSAPSYNLGEEAGIVGAGAGGVSTDLSPGRVVAAAAVATATSSTEWAATCALSSALTSLLCLICSDVKTTSSSHELRCRTGRFAASASTSVSSSSSSSSSTQSSWADSLGSVVWRTVDEVRDRGLVPYYVMIPIVVRAAGAASSSSSANAASSAVVAFTFPMFSGDKNAVLLGEIFAFASLFVAAAFVSLYLVFTDGIVRTALISSAPHVDVDRLVLSLPLRRRKRQRSLSFGRPFGEANSSDNDIRGVDDDDDDDDDVLAAAATPPFMPEDLIVQVLLGEFDDRDGGLVRSAVAPRAAMARKTPTDATAASSAREGGAGAAYAFLFASSAPGDAYRVGGGSGGGAVMSLEMEELIRSESIVADVARAMVPLEEEGGDRGVMSNAGSFHFVSAATVPWGGGDRGGTFEEDLLRLALLETLGGSGDGEDRNGGGEEGGKTKGELSAESDVMEEDDRDDGDEPLRIKLGLSRRHFDALRLRVRVSDRLHEGTTRRMQQPVVIPVIRALCAYVGGLGDALVRCCGQERSSVVAPNAPLFSRGRGKWGPAASYSSLFSSSMRRGPTNPPVPGRERAGNGSWSLPPGAAACADYAVLAAARLVAVNLLLPARRDGNESAEAESTRRRLWTSLLVPVMLQSAFRLRRGCLAYAMNSMSCSDAPRLRGGISAKEGAGGFATFQGVEESSCEGLDVFIARYCPDVRRVLLACDEAAVLLLRAMAELGGSRGVEAKVYKDCRTWLNSLF